MKPRKLIHSALFLVWSMLAREGFAAGPGQYRAAHFHSDDLSDAGWRTDLSFEVPAEWPSGVYGIRLRAGEHEDTVPLIVSAAGRGAGGRRGAGPLPGGADRQPS